MNGVTVMKKVISLTLALVLVLAVFAGCAKKTDDTNTPSGSSNASVDSLKTIGDILALNLDGEKQYATYGSKFIYVFEIDSTIYRAITSVDEATEQALFDLDYADPDHDKKMADIVSSLEIETLENLSENILPQEELDKFVGKTGADLLNDGWVTGMGYNADTMEFWLEYKSIQYTVVFEGSVDAEAEDFNEEEAIKPLVIKSVTYNGLGDATNIEIPEE